MLAGTTYGILSGAQESCKITDNHIELAYSAAAALTVIQLYLSNTDKSVIADNMLFNTAAYGSNIALRGIQEDTNSGNNVITGNVVKHDTTLLTSSTPVLIGNPSSGTMSDDFIGKFAAATTLGAVSGKLEVQSAGGTVRGYIPVYTSIT